MTMPEGDVFTPIPMHLANPEALAPYVSQGHARRKALRVRTLVLTADNPTQDLLPQSEARCEAWLIQCGDNDVVISHSKSQAASASNLVAALPNPSGALIIKTFPSPVPVPTNDRTFVTAQAYPTRVTVVEVVYAPD